MASSGGFSIYIRAQDQASKKLAEVNRHLERLSAPTRRFQREAAKLAHSAGLGSIRTVLKDTARSAESLAVSAGRFAAPFAALTGGAGLAGVVALSRQFADWGTNLNIAAKRAGMTVAQLQKLRNASFLAGGSQDAATGAAVGLGQNLSMVRAGLGNKTFMAAMARSGITDWQKQGAGTLMPQVLQWLAGIKNPRQQRYFGEAVFGSGFDQLQPMLMNGVQGLRQYMDAAQQAGLMTTRQMKAAQQLQFEQRRLELSVVGLGNAILSDLVPGESAATGGMAGWIDKNREWLAADISGKIKEISGDIKAVTVAMGGWQNVSGDFLEFWAARFAPGILKPLLRADALIRGIEQYSKHEGVPSAVTTIGGETARGALIGAGVGSVVPGIGTATGAALGAAGGFTSGALDAMNVPGRLNPTERIMANYWLSHGVSPGDVAARIASAHIEDPKGNVALPGDGGRAYGEFQWHPNRQRLFAKAFGHSIRQSTAQEQAAFVDWELANSEPKARAAMAKAHTEFQKGAAFSTFYERPFDKPGQALIRGALAEKYLPAIQALAGQSAAAAAPIAPHIVSLAGTPGPNGKATLNVHFHNPPGPMSTNATVDGDVWTGAPKVTTSMPAGGAP